MPGPHTHSKNISGFDPRSIPGCQLWLDAADSSSVTGTTPVTAWRDKSGNGNNTTTIGGSPSYSSNFITLNGSSTYLVGPYVNTTQTITMFVVATVNFSLGSYGNYYRLLSVGSTAANDYNSVAYASILHNPNTTQIGGYRNSVTNFGTVTTNTTFLIALVYDGTNTINYINGTSVSTAGSTGSFNTSSYSIGRDVGNTDGGGSYTYWPGSVGEVIIYNAALASRQRQAVEGYLAWKWGINTRSTKNLTLGHPFYYNIPFTREFNPVDISVPLFWFDAADIKTITGTSQVTAWLNKGSWSGSATNRVGSVVSGSIKYNGLNALQFPVGTELGFTAAIPNQPRAWFAVFKQTTQVTVSGPNYTQYFAIINQTQGSGQDSAFGPGIPTNTGTSSYVLSEGPSGNPNGVQTGYLVPNGYNTLKQYAWINSSASTSSNFQTVNGTDYLSAGTPAANYTATAYRTDSVTYTINTYWYNNSCDLCEIIMYNTEMSVPQRQQVEGYLAWKWGIQSNLVSTHPFYKLPPSSAILFNPTNLVECSLWLDGSDPLATGLQPTNGTGISTWYDKSGRGNNATAFTVITSVATPTNPTVVSSSLNGLSGLSFTGTSGMYCPAFLTSSSGSVFMVVNFSGSTGQPFIVWKLKYSSYFAIKPGQLYVGLNNSGTYPTSGYDAQATYSNSYGTPYLLGMTLSASSAASSAFTFVGTVNGTATTTTGTSTSGNPASCSDYVGIGIDVESGTAYYPMYGTMYEVIVYNTALTELERQKVEGYLAWKWGLQNSLVSTHPYKLLRSSQIFQSQIIATGGTITNTASLRYHTFTSSGSFVVTGTTTVNYLIVGGGGGGGDRHGGGGGAGGVVSGTFTATTTTYTVTVGAGGTHGATTEGGQTQYGSPAGAGSKGGNSSISSVATANGGGGGGTYDGNPSDTSLGSGGGGGGNYFAGVAGTSGQGTSGGSGQQPAGGGGGGAGGAGSNANSGNGGNGVSTFSTHLLAVGYGTSFATSWVLGNATYYIAAPSTYLQSPIVGGVAYIAAGGGGASYTAGVTQPGGYGGGGRGDWDDENGLSGGTENTGSGGGGSRSYTGAASVGRNGGAGLVLIWYSN